MATPKQPVQTMVSESGAAIRSLVIPRGPLVYFVSAIHREFDFTFLADVFPTSFAIKIAEALVNSFSIKHSRAYNISKLHKLKSFIDFINKNKKFSAKFYRSCKSGRVLNSREMQGALSAWFEEGRERLFPDNATTLAEYLNALRAVFRDLFNANLISRFEFPKMPRNYHVHGKHKPSLVESGNRDEFCAEIISEMRRLAEESGIQLTMEATEYITAMGEKIPSEMLSNEEVFRNTFQKINFDRLQIIRSSAEKTLLDAYEKFQEGEVAQSHAYKNVASKIDCLMNGEMNDIRVKLSEFFPKNNDLVALGNFLTYVIECHACVVPCLAYFKKKNAGSYMRRLYGRFGGRHNIIAMLGASPDGVSAAAILYLVDSGDNVSSAITLSPNCVETTDDKNKVRITSYKARAGWSPIVSTFDINEPNVECTVPQALNMVRLMSERIRFANPKFIDSLFMFVWFDSPSVVAGEFLSNRLGYILRDTGVKNFKEMTVSAIRQSFILDRTLIANGRTRTAEILAKHGRRGSKTIQIYTERWPVRLLYASKIRTFQNILENEVVFNGLKLNKALGLSIDEAKKLLAHAERTGNGLRCRNPKLGEGPTSQKGDDCVDAGSACLSCSMKLFVVDAETIEDMLLTRSHLESEREALEAEAGARWEIEMLPQLAFAIAAIERLRRSPHAALLRKVEKKLRVETKKI